jgi:hypothetical protein
MSIKAKPKSATGPKIKPKARADYYMWAGDLRRALAKVDDDTRVYVSLNGPSVQITHLIYYAQGIEGQKTVLLRTRNADIPQRAEPTLHDIGNMLHERHRKAESDAERHANEIAELKAALKERKAIARKRR